MLGQSSSQLHVNGKTTVYTVIAMGGGGQAPYSSWDLCRQIGVKPIINFFEGVRLLATVAINGC